MDLLEFPHHALVTLRRSLDEGSILKHIIVDPHLFQIIRTAPDSTWFTVRGAPGTSKFYLEAAQGQYILPLLQVSSTLWDLPSLDYVGFSVQPTLPKGLLETVLLAALRAARNPAHVLFANSLHA